MTHSTYPTTGTKQLPATSVSPLEQSGSNKNDISAEIMALSKYQGLSRMIADTKTNISNLRNILSKKHYHANYLAQCNDSLKNYEQELIKLELANELAEQLKPKRVPISQDDFNEVAEVAARTGQLKRRDGEFGAEFAIFLNGHLMMISQVNSEDEREFYKYF